MIAGLKCSSLHNSSTSRPKPSHTPSHRRMPQRLRWLLLLLTQTLICAAIHSPTRTVPRANHVTDWGARRQELAHLEWRIMRAVGLAAQPPPPRGGRK